MLKYVNTKQFLDDYRQYLDSNGIIHAHVARKIGISPQQLQNVYKKQELTVNDIIRLCNAINMDCDIVITYRYPIEQTEDTKSTEPDNAV